MNKLKTILTNVCRLLIAIAFIFSGYVKAVDPLGTQYKIEDYLGALHLMAYVPRFVTLGASVSLSAIEFSIGIFLLLAIRRRLISKVTLVFMSVMTLLAIWIYVANPVEDCGCFGDFIRLTNGETLLKNIVLLGASLTVSFMPLRMYRFISKTNQWIAFHFTFVFILFTSAYSLYLLPVFDFLPYHVGTDINREMEIPEGAKAPEFQTTFILEKDGKQKEFTLEDYPDSSWTFIDSKTVQTQEGYVPPIHDFSLQDMKTGEDLTAAVLERKGYTFLLISPHLEEADDGNFGDIDYLYEYAQEHGYAFYGLTASTMSGVQMWRDITGAEYPFLNADATTLKTMIRSNPGIMLLKDGVIIRKWSHNDLPRQEELSARLEKLPLGHLPADSIPRKIAGVVLWFVLPLFLLTLADRLWAWTHFLKAKKKTDETYNTLK